MLLALYRMVHGLSVAELNYNYRVMPHIHEKIDFTVEVFITHNNQVLLRKHDKYNIWLGVGGHIELDEDPNQAAVREVKEEVGLDIELIDKLRPFKLTTNNYTELIPPFFLNRHQINEQHEHIALTYFAKSQSQTVNGSQTEIAKGLRWFTKEELENSSEISESILYYALQALEMAKQK